MKKFLSLILVFSLLISAVSAAGYYENEPDVSVDLDSSIWWPSDYKISLMNLTPEESTTLDWIYEQLVDIWNDMRAGFTFLDEDIVAGNTVLSNLYTLLDGSDTTLTYILQGVGQTNGYLQITNNRLSDLNGTVGIGNSTLGRLESLLTASNGYVDNLESLMQSLASSLRGYFVVGRGSPYLYTTGQIATLSWDIPISDVVNFGFQGVRSLIAGSESDNVYQGNSINNENESTSFSATGLGPMLNTWLGEIQNDLGLLSFVFASPQDLELKNESEDNMSAIGDSLLSKDSKSSVKVKDISSISSASDSIQDFGDTGVTPAQAFTQLGNSDLLRFFSAQTASDLDSTVSTYSRDPRTQIVTSYYESSRSQFNQIISEGG